MANKSLILGVVVLCALPAASPAQVLLTENFDSVPVMASSRTTETIGQFTATNFGISRQPMPGVSGICRPPAASGHCLVLFNQTGTFVSQPVMVVEGETYLLTASLQGNSLSGSTLNSATEVTIAPVGSRTDLFTDSAVLANGSPLVSRIVTGRFTAPRSEDVVLSFTGVPGSGERAAGMVIDNILLTSAPEPATLGLMVLGVLAGVGLAGRKRRN
jgi:hypothetical protein